MQFLGPLLERHGEVFSQQTIENEKLTKHGTLVGTKHVKEKEDFYSTEGDAIAIFAPSVPQFIRHVLEEYPIPQRGKESVTKRSSWGFEDFFYFDDWKQCVDTFLNHPNRLVEFTEIDLRMKDPTNPGNEVFYDVTGDYIDIGRFMGGEPEHFGNAVLGNPRSLFVTIFINMSISSYVKTDVIFHRSKRVVQLVDWLEMQGIRCSIRAIQNNECGYFDVVAKDFHEQLNLNNIAVATNPDFLRRIMFRAMEYSETWNSCYGSGMAPIHGIDEGISIVSRWQDNVTAVDRFWDNVITKIIDTVESGERVLSIG